MCWKKIITGSVLLPGLFFFTSCPCKKTHTVVLASNFLPYINFPAGSYWIYQDTVSGMLDSCYVESSKIYIEKTRTSDECNVPVTEEEVLSSRLNIRHQWFNARTESGISSATYDYHYYYFFQPEDSSFKIPVLSYTSSTINYIDHDSVQVNGKTYYKPEFGLSDEL